MKVILVNEDSHGLLTVAKDYKAALDYLLNTHWIEDNTEVWDERVNQWIKLKDAQGEDWFDGMCRWSINEFNDYWDGSFYLYEIEVYELNNKSAFDNFAEWLNHNKVDEDGFICSTDPDGNDNPFDSCFWRG